jgi:hypothetical protein
MNQELKNNHSNNLGWEKVNYTCAFVKARMFYLEEMSNF